MQNGHGRLFLVCICQRLGPGQLSLGPLWPLGYKVRQFLVPLTLCVEAGGVVAQGSGERAGQYGKLKVQSGDLELLS